MKRHAVPIGTVHRVRSGRRRGRSVAVTSATHVVRRHRIERLGSVAKGVGAGRTAHEAARGSVGEAVDNARDSWVVRRVGIIADAVRWDCAIRVRILAGRRVWIDVVVVRERTWADAAWRRTKSMLREGCWVDG